MPTAQIYMTLSLNKYGTSRANSACLLCKLLTLFITNIGMQQCN